MHSVSIIVIIGFLSVLFAIGMIVFGVIFSEKQKKYSKNPSLNNGMPLDFEKKQIIPWGYYVLTFIVFSVEMVFLFPFALAFNRLKLFAFGHGVAFLFLLVMTLLYAKQKNLLRIK